MISDTLYAKYIQEREGLDIIECPEGFLTYRIVGEECFLADIYVDSGTRFRGVGRRLLDALEDSAEGCKVISATIWLWDKNASATLQSALKCGFKISAARDGVIIISKEIGGE